LASWARQNLFGSDAPLFQSEKGVHINDKMPLYAFEYMKTQYPGPLQGKKVLLLGVSYLNDVGDTRYTPVEGFYDQLVEAGCNVALHDPHIIYWEEKDVYVAQDLDKLMKDSYDLVVITTGHKEYRNNNSLIHQLKEQSACFVYDTIGVFTNEEIRSLASRHTVKVIGRGDL
jgi:UDP-N-acetyl-D-mannosaminuronate dehydrogenase